MPADTPIGLHSLLCHAMLDSFVYVHQARVVIVKVHLCTTTKLWSLRLLSRRHNTCLEPQELWMLPLCLQRWRQRQLTLGSCRVCSSGPVRP